MRLTGVLVACSMLALTACQSTTQPAVSAPASAQSETGNKQQLVESHVVDGIGACADLLQNGTPLASLETDGFQKTALGAWRYSTGGLFGNPVNVNGKQGNACYVSHLGGISGVQRALSLTSQALKAKGYTQETRTLGGGSSRTYFVKSGTSLRARAGFQIVGGNGTITVRLEKE